MAACFFFSHSSDFFFASPFHFGKKCWSSGRGCAASTI